MTEQTRKESNSLLTAGNSETGLSEAFTATKREMVELIKRAVSRGFSCYQF